ncbi:dihydroorotate dehydrogenase electron transfer subunit [Oceanobacillus neutriphilus]|uniref:Dihydroorotate dehydrogenase B (NAD(+)), electron transfer subunit n=1 Tax=Oceanobacillus neutriphilus TaxID=531815 RepID=A0ABQ2P2E0_9BACI|nr:dihydroorotate dehydrogenase electron transfer subunit [Oceanobacillus neutriphilus]GGP16426.1 dihydroorotate dehydrogenase B (NAD(+)), electron transfer subunit [Oceanobacillus neutriphilus]
MRDYHVTVLSNKQVSNRYWHLIVDSSDLKEAIEPGQFFNIKSTDYQTYYPLLRRPFSIYRIKEDTLEFLYKAEGAGTKQLATYKPGQKISLLGPAGVSYSIPKNCKKILLLARGVGIATLAALAQKADQMNIEIYAILSARNKDDLLATKTIEKYCTKVYCVTEEDKTSDVEHVRRMIHDLIKTHHIDAAYTCGSRRLSMLLQKITKANGITSQVALEEYMACGMGVCYSCVCDIKRQGVMQTVKSCEDGPVFPLEEVIFE